MRFNSKTILILLSVIILFSACGKKEENPPLAKFESGSVLQNEYIEYYLYSTLYKPEIFPTEENLLKVVLLQALKKMAVLEAKEQKIGENPDYQKKIAKSKVIMLADNYKQQEIIAKVITDSLINKFYKEYSPQYRVGYIMRPFVESSTEDFIQSQKDTIEFVYKLLRSGHKFEDLAKKYSQDITSNQKGGDLGFVIGESLGDAILRAVMDTLKDFSYSKPFKGYGGFYILYKGEKRDVEIPPFDQVKARIWMTLNRIRGHKIKELAEQRFDMLAAKYKYQVNNHVIEEIKKKAGGDDSTSEIIQLNFGKLTQNEMDKALATYNKGEVRVAELFANPKKAPINMFEFNDRLAGIAQEYIFAKHAMEIGIDDLPQIKDQVKDMNETLLRTSLYQKEVKEKAQKMLNSLKIEKADQIIPSEKKDYFQKSYFDFEREIREKFENRLKEKYKFDYITQNFDQALSEATKRKEQQNKEREEKKSQ